MKYILSHDLGTSGNKAALFDSDGAMLGSELYNYPVHYFNESWAEQNPNDWWQAVCASTAALIERTHIDNKDIAAVCFSGQMMGCLCVDRKGTPLGDAMIWADQRSVTQTAAIKARITPQEYYTITGHRLSPSYGIEKLMWVRDNQPDIYQKTYKALNAKDYIVLKMTGHFMTEPTDASGFGCMDLLLRTWSPRIIEAAGIDVNKLPDIWPSIHVGGAVTREAARQTGLCPGTPVVLGGGDGMCANVGAGSVRPGKTYCSMGSSAWVATTSAKPMLDDEMRTVCWPHVVPGFYAPNGTMQSGGGAYNWLKNTVCLHETAMAQERGVCAYDLMNVQIEQSPPGANGVIFLPYLLGERSPRWSSFARGTFLGIKMENTRGDLMRSVLEGVAMNLALIFDVFRQHEKIEELLLIGGGAKGSVWAQIIADILGARVLIPEVVGEAASMGAAVTGGVGVGLFKDFNVINQMIAIKAEIEANLENKEVYRRAQSFFEQSYQALESVYRGIEKA